jgi:hypothetical protein
MRWTCVGGAAFGLASLLAISAQADDISDKLDAARTAYGKSDSLRTLEALQSLEGTLTTKLVEQFAKTMPQPPSGWEASPPESQPLDAVGGGLTVTRAYQKGDAALNATLIVDNPSVANTVALIQSPGAPPAGEVGWKGVKIGTDDAMVRFDPANREGEIMLAIQNRAALQIEGSEIASEQILTEAAQGWNLALLKKLLGP